MDYCRQFDKECIIWFVSCSDYFSDEEEIESAKCLVFKLSKSRRLWLVKTNLKCYLVEDATILEMPLIKIIFENDDVYSNGVFNVSVNTEEGFFYITDVECDNIKYTKQIFRNADIRYCFKLIFSDEIGDDEVSFNDDFDDDF